MTRWLNRMTDLLFLPGAERLWAKRMRGSVMVLVYHRVGDHLEDDFFDKGGVPRISRRALFEELRFLGRLGARFMTFRELAAGDFPSSRQIGVVVTFDDGFRDTYELGLPMVEALGGKAVVFQCSAMLDRAGWLPEHRLYRLLFGGVPQEQVEIRHQLGERLGLNAATPTSIRRLISTALTEISYADLQGMLHSLDPGQDVEEIGRYYPDVSTLKAVDAAGHEIGSHGHWHLHRSTIDEILFERELAVSSERLTDILGRKPTAFSFPYGALRSGDGELCARYFRQAATCERTPVRRDTPSMALGRFSWPGHAKSALRMRRWLLTGSV